MTRRQQIGVQLAQLQRGAEGLALRYPAQFSLHHAACLNGDREEIDRRRRELHDTLDCLLDNREAVEYVRAELARMPTEQE